MGRGLYVGPFIRMQTYLTKFNGVVLLLILGELLEAIGRNMVRPYLALHLHRQGTDLGLIGLVLAAGPAANLLVGLAGGSIADRYGRRPLLLVGTFGGGLVLAGFGLVQAPVLFGLLHFLNTAFRSLYRPASMAALADVTPPALRLEAFGLRRVGRNVGAIVGPILGFWLFLYAPVAGFLVAGAATLLMWLVVLLKIPETRVLHTGATVKEAGAWSAVFSDKALLIYLLAGIGFKGCERFFDSYLPALLQGRVDDWLVPGVLVVNALVVIGLQLPVSIHVSRYRLGTVFLVGGLIYGAAWTGFGLPVGTFALLVLTVVLAVGEILEMAASSVFVPMIAPQALRGRYEGAANLAEVGAALMPVLVGYGLPVVGTYGVFVGIGLVAAAAGLLGWWADRLAGERSALSA